MSCSYKSQLVGTAYSTAVRPSLALSPLSVIALSLFLALNPGSSTAQTLEPSTDENLDSLWDSIDAEELDVEEDEVWNLADAGLSKELEAPLLDHCEALMTHMDPLPVAPVSKPPRMSLYLEPAFNSRNRRITDSKKGEVYRPFGNSAQTWNLDESLMILPYYSEKGAKPKFNLMDGNSYQFLGNLNINAVANDTLYWSKLNPMSVVYLSESDATTGRIVSFDIASGDLSSIKDLESVCAESGYTAMGGIFSKPSTDDNLFGFQCATNSDQSIVISYEHVSGDLHTMPVGKGTDWELGHPLQPSLNGDKFWYQGTALSTDLSQELVKLPEGSAQLAHGIGIGQEGDDRLYRVTANGEGTACDIGSTKGLITAYSADGECTALIRGSEDLALTSEGAKIFTTPTGAQDWIAVSNIGYDNLKQFASDSPAPTFFSEIFLANTNPHSEAQVCRLTHHRAFGKSAQNATYDSVLGEPIVSMSPEGTRVLFSSDWYDSGSVDTYVVELPTFTRLQLGGEWSDSGKPNMVTRFAQAGTKFTFSRSIVNAESLEESTIATGSGRITGKQIDLEYLTNVSNEEKAGKCMAFVHSDVTDIVFRCEDNHFDGAGFNIVR